MSSEEKGGASTVKIKVEIEEEVDLDVNIKSEPSSDYDEAGTLSAEYGTVKKERGCYDDDNQNLSIDDKSIIRTCESPSSVLPDAEHSSQTIEVKIESVEEPASLDRRRKTKMTYRNDDEDDDVYEPPTVRKKRKYTVNRTSNVKPTYLKKATKYKLSKEVLKKIEIVTISEEERRIEFEEVAAKRSHFKYICGLCTQGFACEEAYVVHKKVHSPEKGPYECDICHYRHRSEIGNRHHRLRHYRRYRCAECRKNGVQCQFRDREAVTCHVMAEHLKTAWDCQHCGKGFKRPQYLKIHINQMHTKSDHLQCPFCERVFHEKAVYRCHVRKHNAEVKQVYKGPLRCDSCQIDFKTHYAYKQHKRMHRKCETCSICNESCENKEALDRHLRRIHGFSVDESNGYQCLKCPRILVSNHMLKRHMRRMHTERRKDFQCDHCKRFYYTKGEVRTHIMWSHLSLAKYWCECGRVFRSPSTYQRHMATKHEGREVPKRHVCEECQKAFPTKQRLTRHMKVHTDQTYPCSECDATFRSQDYVKVHYKIKHLNMTRAQIKAEKNPKKPRTLNDGFKLESLSSPKKIEDEPPVFCEVRIKEERDDIHVPLFETFLDVGLRCDICQKDFETASSYKEHERMHRKCETCSICNDSCQDQEALDLHVIMKHGFTVNESNGYQCLKCPCILDSHSLIIRHLRRMHTERKKDFQCDHCKRFYYTKGELRTHIMWSHLSLAKYWCECGRVFRSPSTYKRHMATKHEGRELPKGHVCHECQKAFPTKQQLTRHMKVHTDQTYPCSECDATFRSQDYVKVHYKIKHLNMTRAQIKAQKNPKKPRTLNDGFKVQSSTLPKKSEDEQPLYCEVRIKEEKDGIHKVV